MVQSSEAPESCWQAWDRFWFGRVDPFTLGAIRLLCGLVVLYVHLVYTPDLQTLLGPNAWASHEFIQEYLSDPPLIPPPWNWDRQRTEDPRPPANEQERAAIAEYKKRWEVDPRLPYPKGHMVWSAWFHIQQPVAMAALHAVCIVIFVLFTIGLWTRLTSVLAWLAALSYLQRTPFTAFGMDSVMITLLLYLMIGPSGAALSVDRWLAARRGQPAPAPSMLANLALRLMQIHFCIIYLASGLSKLQGSTWWGGTALWYTLINPEYAPMNFSVYVNLLVWLTQHRPLWELIMTGGVVFTLGLEIGFPALVWVRPLRWLMISLAVLLHTGIAMVMGLNTFGLMMLCLLLAFVPSGDLRRFLLQFQKKGKGEAG